MLTPKQKTDLVSKCVRLLKYEKDIVERKFLEDILKDIEEEDEMFPTRADVARVEQRYKRLKKAEELRDMYWMYFPE
jgi:bacterioferritin (cytochrome b1)